ncbi:MAG TPA: alkaline phosphatase PhoX, partial [Candidatus Limnocylindrales bacterium]
MPSLSASHRRPAIVLGLTAAVALTGATYALTTADPGAAYHDQLAAQSKALFGFGQPLDRELDQPSFTGPGDQAVELAGGLTATLVSDKIGEDADMIALWPTDENPTYAIICNEIDGSGAGSPATVQRVRLSDGRVSDMVSGNVSCDPSHRTAWGTIVVGEEAGASGRLYEIIDPLNVTGVTINRATGVTSDPTHVVARTALGQLSYEGVVFLDDGTTYYSDELRPSGGKPGGGIYKFSPSTPWHGSAPISSLAQSPLASGSVAVLRLGSPTRSFADYGQGTNTGTGKWVLLTTPADPVTFNLAATALAAGGYTGYYRPEDMDLDPVAAADGTRRLCWNDTGNDQARQWGETLCLTDTATADTAFPGGYQPVVEPFVIGNPQLRMPDNLDFQPGTGILYLLMDATTSGENAAYTNDQVWACLRDGADPDTLSDGCVRVMNLKDGAAEFTGITFLADGKSFLIHLQHRTQDGRAVDRTTDQILVTGL